MNLVGRAWRGVAKMTWAERRELLIVIASALRCEFVIRRWSLPRLSQSFGIALEHPCPEAAQLTVATLPPWATIRLRIVRRVMRHWPVDGVCLRHTLVAGQRISSLEPVLRIGVAATDPGLVSAHAWLEIDGHSLDVESGDYLPLAFG